MKPNLVLLDTVIVVDLFTLNGWESVVKHYNVSLPSIVGNVEAQFYKTFDHYDIDLRPELACAIKNKTIQIIKVDADEMALLKAKFDTNFGKRIQDGELEALTILMKDEYKDYYFCTADKPAIEALYILKIADRGISCEELLNNTGYNLEKQYKSKLISKRMYQKLSKKTFEEVIAKQKLQSILGTIY